AFEGDHRICLLVDIALEHRVRAERALDARDRETVGLREMQDNVGDVPSFASGRALPTVRCQSVEQACELRVLLFERIDDLAVRHGMPSSRVRRISCATEMTMRRSRSRIVPRNSPRPPAFTSEETS